ncbi:MAG: site-specific integrase [Sphingomonas sp.]|uniref:tyrosine-type recombinase/integrase n=1 Tax=Sphingomonas sp. TaxID=28214 RepID=UPI00122601B9|nr:site-specific integrase [Sphingomonas sp.]THD38301.1 MAG: site-specific integrase [Sphingomonas sp.]
MASALYRLTTQTIRSATKPGILSDGGGLYVRVAPGGSKAFVFIYQWHGRRREMGLGGTDSVSLARAREKAGDARAMVADDIDPIAVRRATRAIPTFGEVADEFIRLRSLAARSDKSVARWKRALGEGGYSEGLRGKRVDMIDTAAVLEVVRDMWTTKSETAAMVRSYIEAVLDAAKAKGYRSGDNPARWKGHLEHSLPKRQRRQKHHAAMPYGDVPAFVRSLRTRPATSARALEFLILCASRSGEVRLADWREFDLDGALWSIPGERMKSGKPHRVPLSPRAVEILSDMAVPDAREGLVFQGGKKGEPMSLMAFEMLLRRMGRTETTHGFRSAFRDFAGDMTAHPREVAEAALAHAVGSEAEQAYRRGDALEKRRRLMDEWSKYLEEPMPAE